jgi:tRNA (uracil-5-)-methyltransferase
MILPTIGSPLQYGYRTKITPHFDKPAKEAKKANADISAAGGSKPDWLNVGFNMIGTRNTVMDIEVNCFATSMKWMLILH